MRLLVVGLGSMGRRRTRLIIGMGQGHVVAGLDNAEARRVQAEEEFSMPCYADLDTAEAEFRPDAVFICTSPASHGPIVLECLRKRLSVFTEINLQGDWYEEADSLAKERNVKIFVSSTFLYRKENIYIQKYVAQYEKINYIYHCGQYLPDWHPWESYKEFFVINKKTNGCREIFAIELPWIIASFGRVINCYAVKSKNSSLEIGYPDNYIVILEHERGNKGVFCVDILARRAVRRLEVYSENMHLFWNGSPDSLLVYDIETKREQVVSLYDSVEHQHGYSATIIENAYLEEIKNFFEVLEGSAEPRHSIRKDTDVLAVINKIEEGLE